MLKFNIWAAVWQNQQNDLCAQWRQISLDIRPAFAVCSKDGQGPKVSSYAQWRRWSDWVECAGWSESSLSTHVILLVLSCSSSFHVFCYIFSQRPRWNVIANDASLIVDRSLNYTGSFLIEKIHHTGESCHVTWPKRRCVKTFGTSHPYTSPDESQHDKTSRMSVHPAKTQISL